MQAINKTIEQIRDELADKYSDDFDDDLTQATMVEQAFCAGFDKALEIDREEAIWLKNAALDWKDKASDYLHEKIDLEKEIEKLKRVIEVQRKQLIHFSEMGTILDANGIYWPIEVLAKSTLSEADAILGEKE